MALEQPLDSDATCEAEKSWTEESLLATELLLGREMLMLRASRSQSGGRAGTTLAAHIDAVMDHTATRKDIQSGDMIVVFSCSLLDGQPRGVAVPRRHMK